MDSLVIETSPAIRPELSVQEKISFAINPEPSVWRTIVEVSHRTEGWVLSKDDYAAWTEGFGTENVKLVAAFDAENGQLVGCLCAVIHHHDNGTPLIAFSMYYVHPKHRRSGLGVQLCKHFLQDPFYDLGKKFCWGVPEMEEKYRSSNIASFKNSPTWKIPVFAATTSDLDVSKLQSCEGIAMVGVKDVDWTKLFDYDAKFTVGYRRDGFLKSFMSLESAYAKIALNDTGYVAGYCVVRKCHPNDLCIGPLYADNGSIASALLKGVLESIPHLTQFDTIYHLPPSTNAESTAVFQRLSRAMAKEVGEVVPMFTDEVLEIPLEHVYCIFEYSVMFV
ncbi:Protein F31F7.1 a [Aphelenchoides avenae]|nr:Protein F31F7.1 a [Aphelenchus avenae]